MMKMIISMALVFSIQAFAGSDRVTGIGSAFSNEVQNNFSHDQAILQAVQLGSLRADQDAKNKCLAMGFPIYAVQVLSKEVSVHFDNALPEEKIYTAIVKTKARCL